MIARVSCYYKTWQVYRAGPGTRVAKVSVLTANRSTRLRGSWRGENRLLEHTIHRPSSGTPPRDAQELPHTRGICHRSSEPEDRKTDLQTPFRVPLWNNRYHNKSLIFAVSHGPSTQQTSFRSPTRITVTTRARLSMATQSLHHSLVSLGSIAQ